LIGANVRIGDGSSPNNRYSDHSVPYFFLASVIALLAASSAFLKALLISVVPIIINNIRLYIAHQLRRHTMF
jgi:hypothetical protein